MGWFGRKRVGWGLRPTSWQGWLLTVVFIAALMTLGATLAASQPWIFATAVVIATGLFVLVAFLTRG